MSLQAGLAGRYFPKELLPGPAAARVWGNLRDELSASTGYGHSGYTLLSQFTSLFSSTVTDFSSWVSAYAGRGPWTRTGSRLLEF